MPKKDDHDFLSTSDVARKLDLTPIRIRQMANRGLLPVVRTASGIRLFRPADVEAERRRREKLKNASQQRKAS